MTLALLPLIVMAFCEDGTEAMVDDSRYVHLLCRFCVNGESWRDLAESWRVLDANIDCFHIEVLMMEVVVNQWRFASLLTVK